MCNCMDEKIEQIKEKLDLEEVISPIDLISGRAILEFEIKERGKKRSRKIPMLLARCPFCGKPYDEND